LFTFVPHVFLKSVGLAERNALHMCAEFFAINTCSAVLGFFGGAFANEAAGINKAATSRTNGNFLTSIPPLCREGSRSRCPFAGINALCAVRIL